jgi:hypothetical protein
VETVSFGLQGSNEKGIYQKVEVKRHKKGEDLSFVEHGWKGCTTSEIRDIVGEIFTSQTKWINYI